jgi:hypothetical protein
MLLMLPQLLVAQYFYLSKKSELKIFSEAPLENIAATNTEGIAIVDLQKQEIAIKIPMKAFIFPNKLMQQHFNETYLESSKYPFAVFKGTINKKIDLTLPSNTNTSISGIMSIHGVDKMEIIEGRIMVNPQANTVRLESKFTLTLADYHIKVPTVVLYKIAPVIEVNGYFNLLPMNMPKKSLEKSMIADKNDRYKQD